ncbi:hypothetical protein [Streptomyces sp. NPDC002185]|uniref:hypothetical protein n=1 Tax=Streptomyces sp. NPDC002185 TaxID=3364636 RepID=UPI0036B84304
MPRHPRLAAVAVATAALGALAAGPAPTGEPAVSGPRVVARFDFAAGQTPENIALEPDGSAVLTFAYARQVVRVTKAGARTVLATLPPVADPKTPNLGAAVVTGIARAHDGTLYVNYATGTAETGVWRVRPGGGAPERIAQLPAGSLPNGLDLDEEHGTLYAADSARGAVWSVPLGGGAPSVWAEGTALAPTAALPFGANGLKLHDGAVWVSNSAHSTLLRIPFAEDRTAGPVETRATGLTGIDDFTFTGHGDTALAALILDSRLELVRADGTHRTVLTGADGLVNPTSVAVRAKTLYVPGAAYYATVAPEPNLLLARITRNKL